MRVSSPTQLCGTQVDLSESTHIHRDDVPKWTKRVSPRPGDTLFSYETRLGEAGYWDRGDDAALGRRMGLLRPRPGKVNPRFLTYAYLSKQFQERIRIGTLHGVTVDRIPVGDLPKWQIALPPLAEQERIAGVLGAFDDLIEVNRRLVADLEGAVLALFAAAGFDAPPSDSAGSRLGDLIMINPRLTKPKGEAPYIDMAALPTENAFIGSHTTRPAQGGARFQNGDTLLARITPCLENGKTGVVTSLGPEEVGVGSTEFIVLRGVVHTAGVWSYCMARSPRFRTFAVQQLSDGTTGRQRLSAEAVANYRVRTPDPNALESFKAGSSPLFAAAAQLSTEIADLTRQRDELLPLLMSGKVVVEPEGAPVP